MRQSAFLRKVLPKVKVATVVIPRIGDVRKTKMR